MFVEDSALDAELVVGELRRGGYDVRLPSEERSLLSSFAAQLQGLLDQVSPAEERHVPGLASRLFPRAYVRDDEAESAFVSMMRDDLLERRRFANLKRE